MSVDKGFGADRIHIGVQVPLNESGRERTTLRVEKWDEEQISWAVRQGQDNFAPSVLASPGPGLLRAVGIRPYEISEYHGNLITQAGWNQLFVGGFAGTTGTKFSSSVGRIGIGTGTTPAASATDTALISASASTGGSNWKLCGATPTLTTSATPCTAVFTATFGANDANMAWNEFAIDQGTANSTAGSGVTASVAPMMNHSVAISQGTKASGQIWTATATLSFT